MIDSSPSDFNSGQSGNNIDSVTAGFTAENICGEGASCLVYHMCLDGLQVAVKRLKKEYRSKPRFVASYRKEFLTGQRLKHDALPVYRRFYPGPDEVYIVMDYIDGVTLGSFINSDEGRDYFSREDNVRRFLGELVSVTGYLHRSGVVHCDLKPANIMMRHSDCSLMLIDLDKSYCDIMDSTHGGTASVSAPLAAGDKPTVFKDFSAIGNIVDDIAARVSRFPWRRFRRFREECNKKDTTVSRLQGALERKPQKSLLLTAAVTATVMSMALLLTLPHYKSGRDDNEYRHQGAAEDVRAAVEATDAPSPSGGAPAYHEAAPAKSKQPRPQTGIEIDIDTPMASFISKVEEARGALSKGITRRELSNYLGDLAQAQSTIYQEILREARLRYPGHDIELAVAAAYERSRAGILYRQFNEAVSDTLRHWDSLSGDDFQ